MPKKLKVEKIITPKKVIKKKTVTKKKIAVKRKPKVAKKNKLVDLNTQKSAEIEKPIIKKIEVQKNIIKKQDKNNAIETEVENLIENEKNDIAKKEKNAKKEQAPIINSVAPVLKNNLEPQKEITKRPVNMYRKIAISFIVLTLILLSVVIYFTFISVEITLMPSEERISDNIIVDIYDKEKNESVTGNSILGIIEQVELNTEKEYMSTGENVLGEEVTGKVTIINNYNKNQPLVATTRLLSSDNKLFRIKDTVNVPAGGSVEVEVYADTPDASMAIEATNFTIPGLWAGLQDKVFAQSKEKFTYSKKIKKFILQSDIDKGVEDLKKALISKAKKQFGESYKGYDKVLFEVDNNLIKVEVLDKVGEEKDSFKIGINSFVAVIAFSKEDIKTLAEKKLVAVVPDTKKLKDLEDDKITYSLSNFNVNQGVATINSSFESLMSLNDNAEIIERQKIIGLTKDQLNDYLGSFKEIESYEIKFSPAFVDKVPNLVDRITINIKK